MLGGIIDGVLSMLRVMRKMMLLLLFMIVVHLIVLKGIMEWSTLVLAMVYISVSYSLWHVV